MDISHKYRCTICCSFTIFFKSDFDMISGVRKCQSVKHKSEPP